MQPVSLPAGVGLTHLRVYTEPSPDGQAGGSPHMHLACAELYCVLRGAGAVELLSLAGGYQRIALHPGKVVHFTPGVIHRLINGDGALEILVMMQNSGLPERGDAIFTFPDACLADAAAYAEAARVHDLASALRRRDLAVRGFSDLLACCRDDPQQGRQRLLALHQRGLALVRPRVEEWRAVVEAGPARALHETLQQLAAIAAGDPRYLGAGQVAELAAMDGGERRLGMCGLLWPYLPEGQSAG